jgi:1-phosphatidylinositol phosphodiesterase
MNNCLGMLYKGKSSDNLRLARLSGRWTGNEVIKMDGGSEPLSNRAPATAWYDGKLYMIFKACDTGYLLWASYRYGSWNGNEVIRIAGETSVPLTSESPSATVYRDRLYVFFKAHGDSGNIHWVTYDRRTKTWSGNQKIVVPGHGEPQTSHTPAAVVYNDRLYVIFKARGDSKDIYWTRLVEGDRGDQWEGNQRITIPGSGHYPGTSDGPAAAAFNNRLYVCFKSSNSGRLCYMWFDGTSWAGDIVIRTDGKEAKSQSAPSIAVRGGELYGELYMVYRGESYNHLLTAYFDGKNWSGNQAIEDQIPGFNPESNYPPSLVEYEELDLAEWMTDLPPETSLGALTIPGTHDTCSYNFLNHSGLNINDMVAGNVMTQYMSLEKQLGWGIRFFDMRCRHIANAFAMHHDTYYLHMDFDQALEPCWSFLKRHPKETIVMCIKNEHEEENCTRPYWQTFKERYVDHQPDIDWWLEDRLPTMEEAQGKIVLVRRFDVPKAANGADAFELGIDASNWPDDTVFDSPAGSKVNLHVQDNYKMATVFNIGDKWDRVSSTLEAARESTEPNRLFINFTSAAGGAFPLSFAYGAGSLKEGINRRLYNYLSRAENRYQRYGIIPMDFPECLDKGDVRGWWLIEKLVATNFPEVASIQASTADASKGGLVPAD